VAESYCKCETGATGEDRPASIVAGSQRSCRAPLLRECRRAAAPNLKCCGSAMCAQAAPGTNTTMLCYECALRPADQRRSASGSTDVRVCSRCGAPLPAGDGIRSLDRFGLDPDGVPLFTKARQES